MMKLSNSGGKSNVFGDDDLLDEAVHGNDWRSIEPAPIGKGEFTDHVTVILPCYMGQKELALTFAGLSKQTYPHHLLEVIVVDDGSESPIKLPSELPFATSIVVQKRDGFGLARARNLGAEKAKGRILIFLDCDMIPEPQLVEAHSRWHHMNKFALTLGFRNHSDFSEISAEDLLNSDGPRGAVAGRKITTPQWIEFHMGRTKDLTSDDTDLFRIATGGNLGVRKSFFESVGGFDADFKQWGGEDIEFGFRAFNSGGILVPERFATAWHQGEGASPDANEEVSLAQQRNRLSHLIAEKTFRRSSPGRSFEVPMLTVSVDTDGQAFEEIASQVDSILASTFYDLLIGLKISEYHPDRISLERQYGPDSRVLIADDIEMQVPFASLRLEGPPGFCFEPGDIAHLVNKIGKHGLLITDLGVRGEIRLARNRALKRSEQLRIADKYEGAGFLFGEKLLPFENFRISSKSGKTNAPSAPSLNPPIWQLLSKVFKKIISIRSVRDLRFVVEWLLRGFVNVFRRFRLNDKVKFFRNSRSALLAPNWIRIVGDPSHFPHARPWRGDGNGVEVVLVAPDASESWDTSTNRSVTIGGEKGVPLAPPIDFSVFNPAGYRQVGSEAKIEPLPEIKRDADFIRKARSALAIEIESVDSLESAKATLKLSALGVPVVVKNMSNAKLWVGEALVSALEEVKIESLSDATQREKVSVRLRRSALKNHSYPQRLKHIRKVSGLPEFREASVSVLVATKRPEMVKRIYEIVKNQDYENIELVMALHGEGFETSYQDLEDGEMPLRILRFSEKEIFGNVMSQASSVAEGEWIAKMDDDDWYGREHISDLILASTYSRADLIGKGSEFVYLKNQDQTIRRDLGNSEVESPTLGGGTLLIDSSLLKEIYGWRALSKGIDVALIEDAILAGGRVWRTHPFGYLLRRTEGQHTWEVDDRYFLRHADQRWDGKVFELVDVMGEL